MHHMGSDVYKFEIFADYFQFILMDEKAEDDFSTIWTDEAVETMLAVGKTAICPGTLRNVDVNVEVEVLHSSPTIVDADWDNIVEASIDIPSGKLVAMGCTSYLPDAPRIEMNPGMYQVLSLAGGIDSIVDESEPADDIYRVYLWPGPQRPVKLIKHWRKSNA